MPSRLNLTGQRYGRWVVLEKAPSHVFCGKYCTAWWCRCDCGTVSKVFTSSLRNKKKPSLSCGCRAAELARLRNRKDGTAFRDLFRRYVSGAKTRSLEFSLSEEEFKNLAGKDCYYCGIKPNSKTPPRSTGEEFVYNGVDRLNPALGYTKENSVACCTICNYMKQDYSKEEFIRQCKSVAVKHA